MVCKNAKYASFSKWAKTCKTTSVVSLLKGPKIKNYNTTESQKAKLTLQSEIG